MELGGGEHRYEWIDGWGAFPDSDDARKGWAHPGIAVSSTGQVITTHPGEATLLVFDPDGTARETWKTDLVEAHGITLFEEGGIEYLWIADNGAKRVPGPAYDYQTGAGSPQAVKVRLGGEVVQRLVAPDIAAYTAGKFSPTSVAVYGTRHGGNGDVWVADGYGQNEVHRFDREGTYLGSVTGEEGTAGAFKTPHAVFVDTRKREPELYVADRANRRIQVYDLDGRFKRVVGEQFLSSPSTFALDGDRLIVGELRARLTVLDEADQLVCYLGENERVCDTPGWPNARDGEGNVIRPPHLTPGAFNSPHGVAVDASGNIYVAEWLVGGRLTKLNRVLSGKC